MVLICFSITWTQVSRNPETGISKGCGYVTMGSINSAKVSITALDGSVSVKLSISLF